MLWKCSVGLLFLSLFVLLFVADVRADDASPGTGPSLRGYRVNHRSTGDFLSAGSSIALSHFSEADIALQSFNVRGVLSIRRSRYYCPFTQGNERTVIYNITAYKLRQCIPDPLGEAAAVMAVANEIGDVVITTFKDTLCGAQQHRRHLNHTVMERCIGPVDDGQFWGYTVYKIQQEWDVVPVGIIKRYYFDKTCGGPYSKLYSNGALASCFRDPYSGQSLMAEVYYDYSTQYATDPLNFHFGINIFGSNNCSSVQYSTNDPSKIPGHKACVREGNHYVYTLIGGGSYWKVPTNQPTSYPTSQPSSHPTFQASGDVKKL
jgi:hypothetical protein